MNIMALSNAKVLIRTSEPYCIKRLDDVIKHFICLELCLTIQAKQLLQPILCCVNLHVVHAHALFSDMRLTLPL